MHVTYCAWSPSNDVDEMIRAYVDFARDGQSAPKVGGVSHFFYARLPVVHSALL